MSWGKSSADWLHVCIQYVESARDICNLALVCHDWYITIQCSLQSQDFIQGRESLSIEHTSEFIKNIVSDMNIDKLMLDCNCFPHLISLKIVTSNLASEVVDYIIQNAQNLESLQLCLNYPCPSYFIQRLCSKLLNLKNISIIIMKYQYNKNGDMAVSVVKKRHMVVKRPRIYSEDAQLLKGNSIWRYLEFYTQDIFV
ncbi:uncharacterized protein CMU_017250 [Cryptosporidium muris RN66]|uniref:F-box domain-containing protein n=1 Tax=Cryptosporidium muris (strain RN66) TaxID=441375 RepID=B6ACW9_CRYMR|nr:uncharacterized protein CMU_017250 [Cryptosporidium muris RN66]EEA05973.1 hypothetical protein CMU_017250 [Cryptosporidium muris RN66]|eukprot:XP_002140322.1 hypothetical protein [Cryptosporidium muris RN66]